MNSKIKIIALSVSVLVSTGAYSALGGLKVHSNLGEPFSGTVTVTGNEAKELLQGGQPSVSDSRIQASVRKVADDKAVVSLRSRAAVNDPVVVFQVKVGSQAREYTAIVDPVEYVAPSQPISRADESMGHVGELKPINTASASVESHHTTTTAKKTAKPAKTTKLATKAKRTTAPTQPVVATPKVKPTQATAPAKAPEAPIAESPVETTKVETTPTEPMVASQAASSVLAASQTVELAASQVQAASTVASEPVQAASTVAASQAPAPVATEEPAAEEGLSMPMLAGIGGIGLLALLLLVRLFKSNKSPAPVVPTPVAYGKREEESHDDIHHDDIHIADDVKVSPATPVVDTTPVGDDFKIDLDSLAQQQGAIPSSAVTNDQETLQRANVDWDKVESTESVYEDDAAAKPAAKSDDDELPMQQSEVVSVSGDSISGSVVYQSDESAETLAEEPAMEVDAAESDSSKTENNSDRFVTYQAGDDWMKQAYATTEDTPVPEEQRFVDEPIFADTANTDNITHATEDQFTQEREKHARELAERGMQSYVADDSVLDFVRQGDQGASETGPKFEESDFTWHTAAETAEAAKAESKPASEQAEMKSYVADDSVLDFVRQGDQGASETGPKFEEGDFTWHTAAETAEAAKAESKPASEQAEMKSYVADDSVLDFVRQGDQGASETGPKFEESDFTWHTAAETAAAKAEKVAENFETYTADDAILSSLVQDKELPNEAGSNEFIDRSSIQFNEAPIEDATEFAQTPAQPVTEPEETHWESDVATDDSDLGLGAANKPIAEGTVDWSSLDLDHQEAAQAAAGFVTESVGMTAPLEAKYELAEMYIEIGDMDAARSTLSELLEESRGEIYDKSKALLAKLMD